MHPSGRPDGPAPSQVAPAGYRLLELLGRGGMGEVYLADDLTLGRKVAIKFLLPDKKQDPEARRRLLREAQAAASLDHPGICAVFEMDETPDGRIYIVMQYVEGETLARVLERGPMPVRDALALCAHVAEALAAAHHHGVVHRDLKPANVIVTPSGRPKLLDLGIAKIVARTSAAGNDTTWSNPTEPGNIIGTPGYMSPEQVQQRPVDGRSDLFSLGVVLFECLTGRRAFDGSTTFETIANVMHVHPPAPSSLRPELDDRHDELCARLMAKDREDRFQSADEVVGAIRMLSSQTRPDTFVAPDKTPVPSWWSRHATALAITAVVVAAAVGGWIWTRPRPLPPAPDTSQRYYERGTEALRDGAYFSAIQALEQAIRHFSQHALAHARLAEAHAELDNEEAAKTALVHVSNLVGNESRLPKIERLRVQAARALVLRDVDTAVSLYRQLVDLVPDKSRAWLDVGRAQEAAGLRTEARASYEHAIAQDKTYAAAHLRLGTLHGLELKRDEALAEFAEAERLYRAMSDEEGVTEVMIRRGALYDAVVERKLARPELERARSRATESGSVYQQVRAQIALSSVTASDGQFEEAQKLGTAAVQQATQNHLETVAADGLVQLAALMQTDRPDEAARLLDDAIQLAESHKAHRTASRARLQLANVRYVQSRYDESIALVDAELPFLQSNRYRRFESYGLSIKTRALQSLDRLDEARTIGANVLTVAQTVKDDAQIALSGSNLASVMTALGSYPDALRLREKVEGIRVKQDDRESLPYDLANRADLLIRLGRTQEADRVLNELEASIAERAPGYGPLAPRTAALRALYFATALRCEAVPPIVERVRRYESVPTSARLLTPAIGVFCESRQKRPVSPLEPPRRDADPSFVRERDYWVGAAALERGDGAAALAAVNHGLTLLGNLSNDELRWRLAAVGAVAASISGDEKAMTEFTATARTSLGRMRSAWNADFQTYEQRADLIHLRKRSGLS
jgi:tetratricopeptide (TPR) repeat protein